MKTIILAWLAISTGLGAAWLVQQGPFWAITVDRIDIEGYPVYQVWRNALPFATATSRSQAEWYTLSEEEKQERIDKPYRRGWDIAKIRSDRLRDGSIDETWQVWRPDEKDIRYFKSFDAAVAHVRTFSYDIP